MLEGFEVSRVLNLGIGFWVLGIGSGFGVPFISHES
ncbi:hypothetical protein ES703_63997 [subsurface metagenome]|jgi:hypothetical protein